ncbi:MAG: carboxypeptidase regulatory-like domain-containing protein, partial [bacterium]
MDFTSARWVLPVFLLTSANAVRAQVPASTAVRVTTGTLAGIVKDTLGNVLADVDVSIPDIRRSARSDAAGNFVLAQIPPGTYEVWTRRIGYIIVQFKWTARADERLEVALTMRPLPHTLDPVTIWASEDRQMKSKSLVKGIVMDSAGFPVQGVEVQLIGSGRATVTGSDGTFAFRHVKPGQLIVRARLLGYSPSTSRFQLVEDDEREVFLRMGNLAQQLDE